MNKNLIACFHCKLYDVYCSVACAHCRDVNNCFHINETCNGCVYDFTRKLEKTCEYSYFLELFYIRLILKSYKCV